MSPGDEIDNDCDGEVDEEDCDGKGTTLSWTMLLCSFAATAIQATSHYFFKICYHSCIPPNNK